MKKFISIILVIGLVAIISCEKNDTSSTTKQTETESLFSPDDYRNPEIVHQTLVEYHDALALRAPKWWKKFKKWVKAHTGTHLFEHCQGNGQCGPCPGICLSIDNTYPVIVQDNYELTSEDIANGEYLFILHEYEEDQMVMSFINTEYFVYNDYFYLPSDWDLGPDIASEFNQESIIIEAGVYPVFYDYSSGGETIVDVTN